MKKGRMVLQAGWHVRDIWVPWATQATACIYVLPLAIRSSGTRCTASVMGSRYCECQGLTSHNPITACSSGTRCCKRDGTSVIYGCHGRPQPLHVYMCPPLAIRSSGTRYCECQWLTAHNPITACSSGTRYCKRVDTSVIYGCHRCMYICALPSPSAALEPGTASVSGSLPTTPSPAVRWSACMPARACEGGHWTPNPTFHYVCTRWNCAGMAQCSGGAFDTQGSRGSPGALRHPLNEGG